MGAFSGRWKGIAALGAVVAVLATLGITHRGVPAAEVDLHDGGVWVTNESLQLAAHLNYPSRTLDGGVRAGSAQFELSQRANEVLVHDRSSASLAPIDTANLELGNGTALPDAFDVIQGGPVTAIVQPRAGKVWAMETTAVSGFSPETDPLVESEGGIRAAVGTDGTVHTLTPDGKVTKITAGTGEPSVTEADPIADLGDFNEVQVAAVGQRLVALDRSAAMVRTSSGSSPLPNAAEAVLQQSGPESTQAVVASPTALLWAPLSGGSPVEKMAGTNADPGTPVAPVYLDGCAYGAWAGTGRVVRDCIDNSADLSTAVDQTKAAAKLRFRVNRDVIVLNDVATGLIVLVNDDMTVLDNWQNIQSQIDDTEKSDKEEDAASTEIDPGEKTTEQRPPIAMPDEFGVRAGRSTTLPVLANDSDPDGDPLTATPLSEPKLGPVGQVRGGAALRIAVPEDASGSDEFKYRADDGRGGSAEALVRVSVHPPERNDPPKPLINSTVTVGQGDEVSYAVLPDWMDPNGDDFFVSGATGPAELSVRHRPDGLITIRDLGTGSPGLKEIAVTVTDGASAGQGTLKVLVKPKADLPPVANADHAVTWKGQQSVVQPLLNDTDPNGTVPRLASVAEAAPGERIMPDTETGKVAFVSDEVGSHHVAYTITDGPNQATGTIRIDVLEPQPDAPPIADNDLALLAAGGAVNIDVLGNDSDPRGGVLVIQSVSVPQDAPISVQIVEHARLRVSAPAGLPKQTSFTYTISNGTGSATGQVTVVPMPTQATTLPPIATEDTAVVRAGDIVTIPVLANDSSPTGLPLELLPELQTVSGGEDGVAFTSGRTLRYRAGANPGTVRLTYTIQDSAGNPASAQAVINVTPAEGQNSPPRPQQLTGRVLAGGTVRIPVPTDGIDPNGDSVTLTGLGSAPGKGTATVGGTYLEYTAPADATGSDTFTYTVTDRFGQAAEAEVRVGIAPPPGTNQAPIAVPDTVTVRPGRSITVPALSNDIDPDGDKLALMADSVTPADEATRAPAVIEGDQVTVQTANEGVLRYYYDITDNKGGQARGVITINVSPDAPLKAPIARDDVLTAAEVAGKPTVDVDVLANDSDPDGNITEATLKVDEAGASVTGSKITVPVTADRQVVLYSVTDPDGLVGQAAIIVPPGDNAPPTLIEEKIPAKVKAGDTLTINLGEWVRVRQNTSPRLTFEERVKAGPGGNGQPLVKDPTTLVFTPNALFAGPTSITFEVTDGANPDDPRGQKATLTLPIEVESSGLHPPTFRPSEVQVAPLEPAVEIDLAAMVTDPDPGDLEKMRYTLGPVTGGFDVKLNGTTLQVSAPDQMTAGTQGTATITITDGTTEPVTGQIQIRSIASTRPRITVRDAVIDNAQAGQPSQVNLADYITNPFAAENRPVTMVGAPQMTTGQGTATAAGLNVTVTPAAGFHGQAVVTYQLADATGDPGRQVQGYIRLTVQDRPDAPTNVTAVTQASRTATVSWTAGAANGSPITAFTVRYAGGEQNCGLATTCTINGLTNNQEYTFTVVATNAVGVSDPSAASNMVRPDTKPNTPSAPQATDGDQQVSLTWAPATTEGSPVTSYTVEISPSAGATQREVNGNALTWTGLTNGTAYTFRIRAHSRAEEPSDWSPRSAAVIPAGLPGTPSPPTVTKAAVSSSLPSTTLVWQAPSGNGDNNMTYEVRRNGSETVYTGTGLTTQVTLAASTEPQTFQVKATNRKGDSQWSGNSTAIRAFQLPGPVTNLQVAPTGTSHQVRISFGAADGNGASPGEITYYWSANNQGGTIPSGGGTITSTGGFPNGDPVTVQIYARSTVDRETATGPAQSARVTAYGPPTSPSISCGGGYQQVHCSWNDGSANGRTTRFQATGDLNQTVGSPDSWTFNGIGASATRRICIQAIQEGGATGANNCAQGTSNPPPVTTWSKAGRTTGCPAAWGSNCYAVNLSLRNYRPNSQVYCSVPGVGGGLAWSHTIGVDANGNTDRHPVLGGSPYDLRAGNFTVTNDFGTCTQR